ncbi:MAG: DMT family transporter [Oligoflexia bacterium]|nr:DMT family transporter [Oligoflexia bacterium]
MTMRARTLIGLILCNLIWSANPAVAKVLLAHLPPAEVALFRHGSALAAFIIGGATLRACFPTASGALRPLFALPRTRVEALYIFLLGLLTFFFSPFLQMTGLSASRATDNALIIAMEPLITVLFAGLFLGERVTLRVGAAFLAAFAGFSLLSGLSFGGMDSFALGRLRGNATILLALFGEAACSIFALKLMRSHSPSATMGSGLAVGVGLLALLTALTSKAFSGGVSLSGADWAALMWLGPLGTTVTYLYWMFALARVPLATLAITLFIQPLCGALWGHLFLEERLTGIQALGGGLILFSVVSITQGIKLPGAPKVLMAIRLGLRINRFKN